MYTVKSLRYTDAGWVADVRHDGAILDASVKAADVTKQECHNFDDVCEAIKDRTNSESVGTVIDVQGYKALDRDAVDFSDIHEIFSNMDVIRAKIQAEHFEPRTEAERDLDQWQAETYETRQSDRPI